MRDEESRSRRIASTRTIILNDAPERIFPLFGPIREKDWAPGWDPQVIYTDSGGVEEHMVFTTRTHHGVEDISIWTITRYQPEDARIEYMVFAPNRLWRIAIRCRPGNGLRTTQAEIAYSFTGLTPEANEINKAALSQIFQHNLKDWEGQINRYLKVGAANGA